MWADRCGRGRGRVCGGGGPNRVAVCIVVARDDSRLDHSAVPDLVHVRRVKRHGRERAVRPTAERGLATLLRVPEPAVLGGLLGDPEHPIDKDRVELIRQVQFLQLGLIGSDQNKWGDKLPRRIAKNKQ